MSEIKRVEVKGAAPRYKGDVIEPVEILISGHWPFSSKDELSTVDARLQADAQMLFNALPRRCQAEHSTACSS